jgi:3-phenylpropionate/trans-cinnamate dioxygenase ferredoxin subunit
VSDTINPAAETAHTTPPATENGFHFAASIGDVAKGKTICIVLAEREILLCHTHEGFYAVDNLCTHAAEKLDGGRLKACKILCPLHGAAFDVRDGTALSRPATIPLQTYPVKIEGDSIFVAPNPSN